MDRCPRLSSDFTILMRLLGIINHFFPARQRPAPSISILCSRDRTCSLKSARCFLSSRMATSFAFVFGLDHLFGKGPIVRDALPRASGARPMPADAHPCRRLPPGPFPNASPFPMPADARRGGTTGPLPMRPWGQGRAAVSGKGPGGGQQRGRPSAGIGKGPQGGRRRGRSAGIGKGPRGRAEVWMHVRRHWERAPGAGGGHPQASGKGPGGGRRGCESRHRKKGPWGRWQQGHMVCGHRERGKDPGAGGGGVRVAAGMRGHRERAPGAGSGHLERPLWRAAVGTQVGGHRERALGAGGGRDAHPQASGKGPGGGRRRGRASAGGHRGGQPPVCQPPSEAIGPPDNIWNALKNALLTLLRHLTSVYDDKDTSCLQNGCLACLFNCSHIFIPLSRK
jgi:hypothetical protein